MAVVLFVSSCGGTSADTDGATAASPIDAATGSDLELPGPGARDDGSVGAPTKDLGVLPDGAPDVTGLDASSPDRPDIIPEMEPPVRPSGVSCRRNSARFSPGPYPADVLDMVAITHVAVRGTVIDVFPQANGFNSFNITVEDWNAVQPKEAVHHFALRVPLPTAAPVLGQHRDFAIYWFAGNGEGIEVGTGVWELDPVAFPRFVADYVAMKKFVEDRAVYDSLANLDAIVEGTVVRAFGQPYERTMVVNIDRSLCGPITGEIRVYFDQAGACVLGCGPPPPPGSRGVYHLTWRGGDAGSYLQRLGSPRPLDTWGVDERTLAAAPALQIEGAPVVGGIRRLLPGGDPCWLRLGGDCSIDAGSEPDAGAGMDGASLDAAADPRPDGL